MDTGQVHEYTGFLLTFWLVGGDWRMNINNNYHLPIDLIKVEVLLRHDTD